LREAVELVSRLDRRDVERRCVALVEPAEEAVEGSVLQHQYDEVLDVREGRDRTSVLESGQMSRNVLARTTLRRLTRLRAKVGKVPIVARRSPSFTLEHRV
jgi:hypothetical protein